MATTDRCLTTKPLHYYMVLYRERNMPQLDQPFGFGCWAEDGEHAQEQCVDVNNKCEIVWTHSFDGPDERAYSKTLAHYYMSKQSEGV